MVQISGKYQRVQCENLEPHLISLGVPDFIAKMAVDIKDIQKIQHNGDEISISFRFIKKFRLNFILNQESIQEYVEGYKTKTFSVLEGDTLTLTCTYPNGKREMKIYTFTDSTLTVVYKNEDPSTPDATIFYIKM